MQGLSAPTDSIYKFSAIAGLLMIAASGIGIYDMSRSELLARREMVACYAQTLTALKEDKNDVAAEKFVALATDAMANKKVMVSCGRSLRKLNANPEAVDAACRFDVATIAAAKNRQCRSRRGPATDGSVSWNREADTARFRPRKRIQKEPLGACLFPASLPTFTLKFSSIPTRHD